jgi:hypothetical protein
MAKVNDDVFYFPDYGSANPVPLAAKVIAKTGNNVSLYVFPFSANLPNAQIMDEGNGFVPEGTTLQECLNPGNRWVTREQAEIWGVI